MWVLVVVLLARKLCVFFAIRMKSFSYLQMLRMFEFLVFSQDHQDKNRWHLVVHKVLSIVQIKVSNLTSVHICELGSGTMREVVILGSILPMCVS